MSDRILNCDRPYEFTGESNLDNKTYRSWLKMRERCFNPKNERYHRYGGRGITVCERWLSFANFIADMGERPEGMTLDRKNTDGNYEPGNCKWSTTLEQNQNASLCKPQVVEGVNYPSLGAVARAYGVDHMKLTRGLAKGKLIEEILGIDNESQL